LARHSHGEIRQVSQAGRCLYLSYRQGQGVIFGRVCQENFTAQVKGYQAHTALTGRDDGRSPHLGHRHSDGRPAVNDGVFTEENYFTGSSCLDHG
jgi:hypothetical protein